MPQGKPPYFCNMFRIEFAIRLCFTNGALMVTTLSSISYCRRHTRWTLLLLTALAVSSCASPALCEPQPIGWNDLVPSGWPDRDPLDGRDISNLSDQDPEAKRLYAILREYLDNAPVVEELHGRLVSIPGYVVPIDFFSGTRQIKTFLLVPFQGACIHVPPPASNQIVLVNNDQKDSYFPNDPEIPVRVSGLLTIDHIESDLAVSSYRLDASSITAYGN